MMHAPRHSVPNAMEWVVGAVLLLPVLAGLLGTLAPAFGLFPGMAEASWLAPWHGLLVWPGLRTSVLLTLRVGLGATALSLATALALAMTARRSRVLGAVQAALPPLLAVPHVALAVGLAFLVSPSGWLARLASPWLTGWHDPPGLTTVHDAMGFTLIAGLWLKETPFLLLMTLAATAQVQAPAALRTAGGLGYDPLRAWLLVVLPPVWPQLRLPVFAVLTFSLSVVDVPLVLGPSNPPPLAVQVVRWFSDPDLGRWPVGCAGAVLLAGLVGLALASVLLLEALMAYVGRALRRTGLRGRGGGKADACALLAGAALSASGAAGVAALALWAGAAVWRFPASLPAVWSTGLLWQRWAALGAPAVATAWLATCATVLAMTLAVALLHHGGSPRRWMFLPLLLPQPAFLWGQQILLVRLGLDGSAAALVWSHLVFVLPYVVLALARPWRALDPRYARTAASLGSPPWRVLWRVTLPLLARPLLASAAVGFAVSVTLYLPTLFAGAGRVATLATEAVSRASGPDRRLAAAAALAQAALPLAVYALALGLPAWRARLRQGMALAR